MTHWGCSSGSDPEAPIQPVSMEVQISSPENTAAIAEGNPIQFEGRCTDEQGQDLEGDALEWRANADGRLGFGQTVTMESMRTGTQQVTLTCTDAEGNVNTASVDVTVYATAATGILPDTGQVISHTDAPGEDADYTTHPPGYVKLDAQGNVLNADAPEWAMVTDAVTGLIWEVKTDDDGLHDKDNVYAWHDAQAMIDQLNQDGFGGHDDWRLPTAKELSCLVQAVDRDPMVDATYFPHTQDQYWSSTTDEEIQSANAWTAYFGLGATNIAQMRTEKSVRAVRGENRETQSADNGDGTVTDLTTGLMWQQNDDSGEMTWEEALAYCESLNLAGHDDWRMPNRNELHSIVDRETVDPAIDTAFFPTTIPFFYWSSTSQVKSGEAFSVNFFSGNMSDAAKNQTHRVRAVRGGTPKTPPPTSAPAVTIANPTRNETFPAGDQIELNGSCKDSAGGDLTGDSLVWTSDVDGPIGTDSMATADTLSTGTHLVTLSCTDTEGAAGKASVAMVVYATESTGKLPDTGQNVSYTNAAGEDSDHTRHRQGYVKLDAEGNMLPADATQWAMVRDAVTGLLWEVKTEEDGIHHRNNIYSWQDAREMIDQMNRERFGGYSDWRLPTVKELSCLVHADSVAPDIDTIYFPHTTDLPLQLDYWSSTTDHETNSANAWWVHFGLGRTGKAAMRSEKCVRAVRGEARDSVWVDNGDGTVTDTTTGLMWQQVDENAEMTWEEALAYCETLSLAGHENWRLPNRNELLSLTHNGVIDPAIDGNIFPDTKASPYWSATTRKEHKGAAYSVNFFYGDMHDNPKQQGQHVRAVRRGD